MLSPLDDTLWHQIPTTFDHVGTSDPRFFDRYWFASYDPDRDIGVQLTMGAYRNMNVLDGGVAVVVNGRQHNIRVSRSLDRDADSHCCGLRVDPIVPLKEIRLTIDQDRHPIGGEITWRAIEQPSLEHPHFERHRGRVAQEYQRFTQVGVADGWLVVDGERIEIRQWWACRDHSWGVRRGMGIPEPVTGPRGTLATKGHVQSFLYFSTETVSGKVHLIRRGDDEPYATGVVTDRETAQSREVRNIDLDVDFFAGTRRFESATLGVTLDDGEELALTTTVKGPSFAMPGLGYSGGYNDRGGPGVWRGESYTESDIWDVTAPSLVGLPGGSTFEPWHRIQPVHVRSQGVNGAGSGTGSFTLTVSGKLPHYLGGEEPGALPQPPDSQVFKQSTAADPLQYDRTKESSR